MTKIREHSYAVIKHWVVLLSGIASLVLSLLERFRRSCRRRSPAEIVTQTTDCPVRFWNSRYQGGHLLLVRRGRKEPTLRDSIHQVSRKSGKDNS